MKASDADRQDEAGDMPRSRGLLCGPAARDRFLRLAKGVSLAGVVAACSPSSLDQPLSPFATREALVERQLVLTENGENVRYLYLRRNFIAAINGVSAELGKWRIDDAGQLCLLWRDQPERCAPVYATGGSQYRFGDSDLSVLGP